MKTKKTPELVVISDLHLGTYGCHAKELIAYLQGIKPKCLVLNGDIVDIWQFRKSYWPKEHTSVISEILQMMASGTEIIYIPGNHDEIMRRFVGFTMGNFKIQNKAVLNIDGKTAWIFHGDVFDVTMKHSKWLAKLGGFGYDLLIYFNRSINNILERFGKERISLSKKIKDSVKSAVNFVSNFEETVSEIGISKGYDYVICGHIHQPKIKKITTEKGSITYLNSGDWIENLTVLEYEDKEWSIAKFEIAKAKSGTPDSAYLQHSKRKEELTAKELFSELINEFELGHIFVN